MPARAVLVVRSEFGMVEECPRGEWLATQRSSYLRARDTSARREARWSWSRLVIFAAAIVSWAISGSTFLIATGATVLCALAFAVAVRRHHRARDEREQADRLLLMVDEAERRFGGTVECVRSWQRPADDPAVIRSLPTLIEDGETWELSDQERDDLDVFAAPVGIFGLLNRTSTALGACRLRAWLDHPCLEASRIRARQIAVRWLVEHGEARLSVMAAAASLRNEDARMSRFIAALRDVRPLDIRIGVGLLRIWGVSSTVAVVIIGMLALGNHASWSLLFGPLALVNGIAYYSMREKLAAALRPWRDVAWAVRGNWIVARHASRELPAETLLSELRERFERVGEDAVLGTLSRKVGWSEGGGLVHELFNLIGFFDVHVADSIIRIALRHRADLLAGASAMAELEAFASLGCFAWEQPLICWPAPDDRRIQDGAGSHGAFLEIFGGVHPLVSPQRAVENDVRLTPDSRFWLITGSNMAGKSTFLRMSGVTVLLAQIGSAAPAREVRWTPVRLISDLRARDSLAASESYFLSEVRHLRRMVIPPPGDRPILGLIDEPFRGTNSQDQTAASVAVVRHLLASPHLFLLATHDRHLTTLADGRVAANFHFRENLGSDGLVFDYRLHDGPATTRNALRILEREGYPPALVAEANAWLRNETLEPSSASARPSGNL
jgi:hypothetical protein